MKSTKLLFKTLITVICTAALFCVFFVSSCAASVPVVKSIVLNETTADSVSFSWSTKGNADGYRVYSYNFKTKKYEKLKNVKAKKYTANKLDSGESYIFAVKPYTKANGKTTFGKLVKITCYTTLEKVSGIKQSKTAETSHKLSWTAVKGANNYRIYYYKEATGKYTLLGSTAKTYCTVSKLQPTKTYKYIIRAVSAATDGKTVLSGKSSVFYAYTKPAEVSGFTSTTESTTGYHLEWNAVNGAQGYKIYKFNEKSGKFTEFKKVQGTSYTVRDLAPATTTVYKICAYATLAKKVRYSNQSQPLTVTTKPEAVKPFVIEDGINNSKIKIGWNNDVTADGYLVYVSSSENGPYYLSSKITNSDTTEFLSSDITNGVPYYFKIKTYIIADNKYIYSANSSAIEAFA